MNIHYLKDKDCKLLYMRYNFRTKHKNSILMQFLQVLWLLFSCSVAQSCLTLRDPVDYSTPGFPVLHCFTKFAQTHVHWVAEAIQPSHPLLSPPPTFNLSQHQGLFQWVSSLHQVVIGLELQLQHQSFQWIFMVDFL